MAVYNIPSFKDVDQFLQLIAAARGKLGKVCCQLTTDCSDSAVTTHDCAHCVMTLQLDCRPFGARCKRPSLWPRQGGTVNTDAAARIVLTDWNDGRIPYYTEPPQRQTAAPEDAAIVSNWGADFDADQVFAFQATATPLLRCRGIIPAALQHTVLCRFSKHAVQPRKRPAALLCVRQLAT